jgi:hypothetical protein
MLSFNSPLVRKVLLAPQGEEAESNGTETKEKGTLHRAAESKWAFVITLRTPTRETKPLSSH